MENSTIKRQKIYAAGIIIFIIIVAFVSLYGIFRLSHSTDERTIAEVYQNGLLIKSIDLSTSPDFDFRVDGNDNCYNIITVRNSQIAVTEASCPDKICVHQGFIGTSGLPVTCLPNKLVIIVKRSGNTAPDNTTDIIAY